jgi:hypothetical protein
MRECSIQPNLMCETEDAQYASKPQLMHSITRFQVFKEIQITREKRRQTQKPLNKTTFNIEINLIGKNKVFAATW